MRKTIKQLEAELAKAQADAAQWKEAHRQLAEAMTKNYPYPVYVPYIQTLNPPHPDLGPWVTYTTTDTSGVFTFTPNATISTLKVTQ